MRAGIWLGFGVMVTVLLVSVALLLGWAMVSRGVSQGMVGGMHGYRPSVSAASCPDAGPSQGDTAPGAPWDRGDGILCSPGLDSVAPGDTEQTPSEDVEEVFHRYLADSGLDALELTEIMEFRHNYYAVAVDPETGVGAMELILDKASGAVGPEVGPNMMWNVAYGMHRGAASTGRHLGGTGSVNQLSEQMAIDHARAWLTANRWGERPEAQAEVFYGYFTIHTLDQEGEVVGMLSVHGDTGKIWYHSWHGDFVTMASPGDGLP
jgi:hypothetical protein